jgi:hypothetical protein
MDPNDAAFWTALVWLDDLFGNSLAITTLSSPSCGAMNPLLLGLASSDGRKSAAEKTETVATFRLTIFMLTVFFLPILPTPSCKFNKTDSVVEHEATVVEEYFEQARESMLDNILDGMDASKLDTFLEEFKEKVDSEDSKSERLRYFRGLLERARITVICSMLKHGTEGLE